MLPDSEAITNEVFHRLFRTTASKLHPDREPDPGLRLRKQGLMANLLKARSQGDVMTLLGLYHEFAADNAGLSHADENQLLAVLENQILELEDEQDHIIEQSPMHEMVYERFYQSNKKKTQKLIEDHLQTVEQDKQDSQMMVDSITSLKTLKPWLEERSDYRCQEDPLEAFMQMFDGGRRGFTRR